MVIRFKLQNVLSYGCFSFLRSGGRKDTALKTKFTCINNKYTSAALLACYIPKVYLLIFQRFNRGFFFFKDDALVIYFY